ncbi:hypothetical protein BZG36_01620 [Bifiguratus adelaidae]|uniref:NF-kappa-B-activating protein C-terminal domain-containing protein n=1 Tax=Bifiguratus adelaidae TaxID=1938954 RepID=A0A261Y4F8_9FUNG|nr:hypothetical protein BZG36_01620 [Bifiguratus adelaidae]
MSPSRDRSPGRGGYRDRSEDVDYGTRRRDTSRDHRGRRDSPDYSPYRGRYDDRNERRDNSHRRSPPDSRDRSRRYNDQPPYGQDGELNGVPRMPGETYFEYRKRVREASTISVWPRSPSVSPERDRSLTPPRKSSKKSRYYDSASDVSETESDSEDDRRSRRKEKKQHHHHHRSSRHSKHKKSSKHKRRRSRTPTPSETERDREPSRARDKMEDRVVAHDGHHKSQDMPNLDDMWVEKQVELPDDAAVGPVPLSTHDVRGDKRSYGGDLLPGEGSAMAAYVAEGKRIPRRGEIGLTSDQIEHFEQAGYVMSGSRHQLMNAVRLRKENQVISAEEKRALLTHAQESRVKRENEIISGFREILASRSKDPI